MKKSFIVRSVAAGTAALGSGVALAGDPVGIDTTGLVATIDGAMTPISAVGLAVLGVLAGILVFKLIRRVM